MLWGKIKPRGPGVREWDPAVSRRCRTELLTEKVALSKDLKEMRRKKPWGSRRWRLPGHVCAGPRGDLRWVRQRRQCRRRWVREVAGAGQAKEGLVGVVRPLAFPQAE